MQKVCTFFLVCRAYILTWWCKSTMGAGSYQPLAAGKGVCREAESEGSLIFGGTANTSATLSNRNRREKSAEVIVGRIQACNG